MSEHEQNLEQTITEVNPQVKLLIKLITIVFLLFSLIAISVYSGLLIQGYLTNHIVCEELIFNLLNISYGIREFYCMCIKNIGYSMLLVAFSIPFIAEKRLIITRFAILVIAIFFLLYSFIVFFDITQHNLYLGKYFLEGVLRFTIAFAVFTDLLVKKEIFYTNRELNNLINSFVFFFVAFID